MFALRRFSPLAKNVHAQAPGSSAAAIPTVARHDQANSCWFDDWNCSALVTATTDAGSSEKAFANPGAPPGRRQSGSLPIPPRIAVPPSSGAPPGSASVPDPESANGFCAVVTEYGCDANDVLYAIPGGGGVGLFT